MKTFESKYIRILAIAPSSRGFGFAVLEGNEKLVDWGVKSIKGDKNTGSLEKLKDMIGHYQPGAIVMENTSAKQSRRSGRIRTLQKGIVAQVKSHKIKVVLFSRGQIRRIFFAQKQGTKHALAEILAAQFPEELASRLPPKRRPWMSEDYRMDIFDAVALALAFRMKKSQSSRKVVESETELISLDDPRA